MSKILNDTVMLKIVKNEAKEEISKGGIITTINKPIETQLKATVFDIGSGKLLNDGKRVAPTVTIGDEVVIHPNVGVNVSVNDVEYRLVKEQDILVIF